MASTLLLSFFGLLCSWPEENWSQTFAELFGMMATYGNKLSVSADTISGLGSSHPRIVTSFPQLFMVQTLGSSSHKEVEDEAPPAFWDV